MNNRINFFLPCDIDNVASNLLSELKFSQESIHRLPEPSNRVILDIFGPILADTMYTSSDGSILLYKCGPFTLVETAVELDFESLLLQACLLSMSNIEFYFPRCLLDGCLEGKSAVEYYYEEALTSLNGIVYYNEEERRLCNNRGEAVPNCQVGEAIGSVEYAKFDNMVVTVYNDYLCKIRVMAESDLNRFKTAIQAMLGYEEEVNTENPLEDMTEVCIIPGTLEYFAQHDKSGLAQGLQQVPNSDYPEYKSLLLYWYGEAVENPMYTNPARNLVVFDCGPLLLVGTTIQENLKQWIKDGCNCSIDLYTAGMTQAFFVQEQDERAFNRENNLVYSIKQEAYYTDDGTLFRTYPGSNSDEVYYIGDDYLSQEDFQNYEKESLGTYIYKEFDNMCVTSYGNGLSCITNADANVAQSLKTSDSIFSSIKDFWPF